MAKKSVKQVDRLTSSLARTQDSGFSIDGATYTPEESDYRSSFLAKLEQTRQLKEDSHDKFNGLGFKAWYEQNDKAANSHVPLRKNPDDINIVTGTTREKVLTLISNVINLVFRTNFRAFDKEDNEEVDLGEAMGDCVERANQIEQWEDKKIYAYYELATQGDVFIEDIAVDEVKVDKKKIKLTDVKKGFDFEGFKPEKALKTMFSGCRRNLLIGTQVYLGNIYETDINKQPHIFTREVQPYEIAKSIYGHLPRWVNVPTKFTDSSGDQVQWGINWRLEDVPDGMVEILKYTDDVNDEYQILLNGVMQLPIGFPKPWEFDGYNIVQGGLEPMGMFAYHKSIPCKTKVDQEVLDEMLKLSVLKGQKSYMPPIANYSGQLLTQAMFKAGKITSNLQKGDLEVLGGNPNMYSMQPSEFQLIDMLLGFIDKKSVSPVIAGQQGSKDQTATEFSTIAQQARRNLGVMIFGFMQFHLKLDMLRLYNVLDNYTKPVDQKLDKVKNTLKNKYRTVSLETEVGNKGVGTKQIQFTTDHMPSDQIHDMENGIVRNPDLSVQSKNPPVKPVKIIQLNPEVLRNVKYNFYPEVEITEKETTMQERTIFTDQMVTAAKLFGIQSINQDYAKHEWGKKNKINPKLFFNQNMPADPMMQGGGQDEVNKIQDSPMSKQVRTSPSGVPGAVRQGVGV